MGICVGILLIIGLLSSNCFNLVENGDGGLYIQENGTFYRIQTLSRFPGEDIVLRANYSGLVSGEQPSYKTGDDFYQLDVGNHTEKYLPLPNILVDKEGKIFIESSKTEKLDFDVYDALSEPQVHDKCIYTANKYYIVFQADCRGVVVVASMVDLVVTDVESKVSRRFPLKKDYTPFDVRSKEGVAPSDSSAIVPVSVMGEPSRSIGIRRLEPARRPFFDVRAFRRSNAYRALKYMFILLLIFLVLRRNKRILVLKRLVVAKGDYSIYKGVFNKNKVEVKVFKSNSKGYAREKAVMDKFSHMHIARCLYQEKSSNNCHSIVFDKLSTYEEKIQKDHIYKIAKLLAYLQGKDFYYLNVAPENILLNSNGDPVLFNFEKCLNLKKAMEISVPLTEDGCLEYRSPEMILHQNYMSELTPKMVAKCDVFSLGILLYKNETGRHPFDICGETLEMNVLKDRHNAGCIEDLTLSNLVVKCLTHDFEGRLDLHGVLAHPYFWPLSKVFDFIATVSDFIEIKDERTKSLYSRLERNKNKLFTEAWNTYLDSIISKELQQYRLYNFVSMKGLLRAIRNKGRHFAESPAEIKSLYGSYPNGFMQYYINRFPPLLMVVYTSVNSYKDEDIFRQFYNYVEE